MRGARERPGSESPVDPQHPLPSHRPQRAGERLRRGTPAPPGRRCVYAPANGCKRLKCPDPASNAELLHWPADDQRPTYRGGMIPRTTSTINVIPIPTKTKPPIRFHQMRKGRV